MGLFSQLPDGPGHHRRYRDAHPYRQHRGTREASFLRRSGRSVLHLGQCSQELRRERIVYQPMPEIYWPGAETCTAQRFRIALPTRSSTTSCTNTFYILHFYCFLHRTWRLASYERGLRRKKGKPWEIRVWQSLVWQDICQQLVTRQRGRHD